MTALAVESVLRSLLMAAVVWGGIKLLRVRHILAQKVAWGLVLLVAFAMPGLVKWQAAHPGTALVLPVKHSVTVNALARKVSKRMSRSISIVRADSHFSDGTSTPASTFLAAPIVSVQAAYSAPVKRWHASDVLRYALPVYLVVCVALLLRLLFGLAMAMRIWRNAEMASPILEPRATVRISSRIQSPVTIGSGIVLPASYTEWDRAKLRLVLAHERSHVRQGDFYLQLLASLYTAVVWFSPLGWWLKRQLADLGEALSDRAALLEAEDNSSYAEVLLEFAGMPRQGFAGVTAGVGMARSSNIQGRIERILNDRIFRGSFASGRRHAVIAALLVPCGLVLATSLLRVQAAERVKAHAVAALHSNSKLEQQVPAAPAAPRALLDALAAPAAFPPMPPPAALPVPPAQADEMVADASDTEAEVAADAQAESPASSGQAEDNSFAIVDGDRGTYTAVHNHFVSDSDSDISVDTRSLSNASGDGLGDLDRVRRKISGKFLWFQRNGRSYVITDSSFVSGVEALYGREGELVRREQELGRQQGELGRQQGLLAAQQAMVHVPAPDLSKQMAELQASVDQLASQKAQEITQARLAEVQARLGELQGQLAAAQALAGAKQAALGSQQGDLGAKEAEFGRQQAELGRKHAKIEKEASDKARSLIDQAFRDGKAKPVE